MARGMLLGLGVVSFLVAGCGGEAVVGSRGDAGRTDAGGGDAGPRVCVPADCDDGVACTNQACLDGECVIMPDDTLCPAGSVCLEETGCFATPRCSRMDDPICDDGQTCTIDACDVATGRCTYATDDAACDDGEFCSGEETCAPFRGCATTSARECDDSVACTLDACDEDADACTHVAENRLCDDGDFCTGSETCDPAAGCVAGTAPDCADPHACTADSCAGGACLHVADDALCAEGEICRLDSGCFDPPRCTRPDDPICDDGQSCTTDSCNVATGRCVYAQDDAACDDGLYCNGVEGCSPFRGCVIVRVSACDDGIGCTLDSCDEASDSCAHVAENRLCDDGTFCNGAEVCSATAGCGPGPARSCDDMNTCTVDRCDAAMDACVRTLRDLDADGDPDMACGGGDCDEMNAMVSSLRTETCNGVDDDCDGTIDDGVASECGDCDPTCRSRTVGGGGSMFTPGGLVGSEVDAVRGGVVVSATTSTNNYLWVPNTNESTLSKWDASTATELGRYRVGLQVGECSMRCCWENGCNMPSRVGIDGNGDAYIANRGFGMQGTVTKVAADRASCIDRNGNGTIETSTGSTPLAWSAGSPPTVDECVLWTANVGPVNAVLRALTIDRGDAMRPEGYVWVGSYNRNEFYKLDPRTGATLATVAVPVRAYGGVVVSDGKLWIGTLDEGAFAYIDTSTNTASARINYPPLRGGCINSYGITADARGRIWLSGWTCNDALGYDPATGQWTRVDTTVWGMNTGRGITVDSTGRIWMAVGGDGQSHVTFWRADDFAPGMNMTAGPLLRLPAGHSGPSGVGADTAGRIWVAHHASSQLVRIDPTTFRMTSFTGPNRVYTYSDFTGAVRRTVIGRGTYEQTFDAGCDMPRWTLLSYDVTTPAATRISFDVRTAATTAGLDTATSVPVATTPPAVSPADVEAALMGASVTPARHLRVVATLEASPAGESPVLRQFRIQWHCP